MPPLHPHKPSSEPRGQSLLFFLALFAALFHRFFGGVVFHRDALLVYAPLKHALAAAWKAGAFPLWDPGQYLGAPRLGAVENGVFHPFNLLFLALPFGTAFNLFTLLHFPLAAFTMHLLLGRFSLGRAPRLLGAVTFPLAGYLVSMHCNVIFLTGLSLSPLVLYFTDRARDEGARFAALAGAAIALQVLAGGPQDAFVSAGLASAWLLAPGGQARSWRRAAGLVLITGLAAVILSLVQTVPALEYTRLSHRGGGLNFETASLYSLPPAALSWLLLPTPCGSFWPDDNFWGQAFTDALDGWPWAETLYVGLAPLALAMFGLCRGPGKRRAALAAGLLLFLFMAFGRFTPVFEWIYLLFPPIRLFRFPIKYLAYFSGALAMAAAFGAQEIRLAIKNNPAAAVRAGAVYCALSLVLGGAFLLLWPRLLVSSGSALSSAAFASAREHILTAGAWFLGANLTLGLLLAATGRGMISRAALAKAAIAIVILDLHLVNVSTMPAGPADLYDLPSAARNAIAPEGPPPGQFRVYSSLPVLPASPPGPPSLHRLVREAVWQINALTPNQGAMRGFEDLSGYGPLKPRAGLEIVRDPNFRQLEIFNVAFLLAPLETRVPAEIAHREFPDPQNSFTIIRLDQALPRAYFASQALTVKDPRLALRLIRSIRPLERIILISETNPPPSSNPPVIRPAEVVKHEPDRVEVRVDAPTAGWLVLSDRVYPGWTAEVDHKPAAIATANLMVRAVRVEKGRHEVVFAYRPAWFWPCLLVSGAGWAVVLGWRARGFIFSRKA